MGDAIVPLADAVERLSNKTPIGSVLKSADWETVPLMLRERAQFSAGVTSMRVLQTIQDRLVGQVTQQREQLANGKQATFDRSSFIDSVRDIARGEGLTPQDPGLRGGLQDITSIPRLGMIYDMQNAMASGYATWKLDQNEGALALWPAYRFGPSSARVPRATWLTRWAAAGAAVGWEGASRESMVALKTSPIWAALSRFGTPWPPFDYGSTRELEDVERDVAVELGLLGPDEVPSGGEESFNSKLQASVQDISPKLQGQLEHYFGDQVEIDGGVARWTGATSEEQSPIADGQSPTSAGADALKPAGELPFSGPAVSREATPEAALARMNEGFEVESKAGFTVRFSKLLAGHLRRSGDLMRARFLPAAEAAVAQPVEVWERDNRHYYIARFKKPDGSLGFVVVTARKGETVDEVITILPKKERELEKVRKGKLVYRLKEAAP